MKIGTASDLHLLISWLLVLYPLYVASANWSQVDSEGRGKTIHCRNMCLPMKGRNNNPKTQKQQAPQGKEDSINSIKVREERPKKKQDKKIVFLNHSVNLFICRYSHSHPHTPRHVLLLVISEKVCQRGPSRDNLGLQVEVITDLKHTWLPLSDLPWEGAPPETRPEGWAANLWGKMTVRGPQDVT